MYYTTEFITVLYSGIHHSAILQNPSQCYTPESITVLYSRNHHSAILQNPSQYYTTESITVILQSHSAILRNPSQCCSQEKLLAGILKVMSDNSGVQCVSVLTIGA